MKTYKIGIIGAGNVAWHLAPALENAGHQVRWIYNRNLEGSRQLQKRLYDAEILTTPDFSGTACQIVLIAVSDDAIGEVAKEVVLPEECLVAHTSGSKPISVLGYLPTEHIGVFYPLQTFSRGKPVNLKKIPIIVEGESRLGLKMLSQLGKSLSGKIEVLTGKQRALLHLAAVLSCNFTNHMLTIAEHLMSEEKLKAEWLTPLIVETLEKSMAIGPERAQTGPAIRNDVEVLDQHMSLLEKTPKYQEIYRVLTQSILDHYQ